MNPFEYIRERITEIADTLAAVDGRDPSWDYADITQLLDNIEKDYNAKYGSSDTVYRSDAINAAIDAADEWDGGCSPSREDLIKKAINKLPSAQPEIIRCKDCKWRDENWRRGRELVLWKCRKENR